MAEETKRCPYCDELIRARATKCKHCGSTLDEQTQTRPPAGPFDDLETMMPGPDPSAPDKASSPPAGILDDVTTALPGEGMGELEDDSADITSSVGEGEQPILHARYKIVETIGKGGMGVVYKAEDTKLGRTVAIKRLLPKAEAQQKGIERFMREANVVAKLNHPNIVGIHDIEHDNNGPFIVMEYVEGKSLEEIIKSEGKIEEAKAIELFKQVCQAISHAHRLGIIHRDIKPANVLVTPDGIPKVLDFGLAQMATGAELSRTGHGMGTMYYMPPEQLQDAKNVDHRADIYALGATLYQILTGEKPKLIRPEKLPEGLQAVVCKCIEEDPKNRYFSISELLADVEALTVQLEPPPSKSDIQAEAPAVPEAQARKSISAIILAVVLVALSAIAIITFWTGKDDEPVTVFVKQETHAVVPPVEEGTVSGTKQKPPEPNVPVSQAVAKANPGLAIDNRPFPIEEPAPAKPVSQVSTDEKTPSRPPAQAPVPPPLDSKKALIYINELVDGQATLTESVKPVLESAMASAGYTVVEKFGSTKNPIELARENGVGTLIVGRATATFSESREIYGRRNDFYQVSLQVKVTDVASSELLFSRETNVNKGSPFGRDRAAQFALKTVAEAMAGELESRFALE